MKYLSRNQAGLYLGSPPPGGIVLATVTDSVNNAVVSASFYHRHNTHATD